MEVVVEVELVLREAEAPEMWVVLAAPEVVAVEPEAWALGVPALREVAVEVAGVEKKEILGLLEALGLLSFPCSLQGTTPLPLPQR